ncbi:MAG TPA: hypothetical protein VFQ00_06375 [Terriglobales bacterium]|nr:hypothetical protein [Terriglobales bacterium]
MGALEGFERKWLFRFTRFVAMLVVLALIAGFVIGATYFGSAVFASRDSHVSPQVVLDNIRPHTQGTTGTGVAKGTKPARAAGELQGIRLPFLLQPYFSDPESRRVLMSHIGDLASDQKQEYVDNLAEVVQTAKSQSMDVTATINEYFQQKSEAISRADIKQTEFTKMLPDVAGAAVSIVGLIALFSLILVLLAIERNTRSWRPVTREGVS